MDLSAPTADLVPLAQVASSRPDSPLNSELAFYALALATGALFVWLVWWAMTRREEEPVIRDPWASALTTPPDTRSPRETRSANSAAERVDGTFGSWVGRGFAVAIGLVAAWFLLLFTAPIGWIAVPFLLAWLWPRKGKAKP